MEDVAPAGGGPHAAPRDAQLIHGRSVRRPPRHPTVVPMQTRAHATTAHAKSLRAHRREAATSSVSLDTSAGSPPRPDGIDFALAALWSAPAGIVKQRGGQNAHDARTQKSNRLAERHCGRTAGRGVYRPAESQHGAEPPGLLDGATPGPVPHGEVDGRWTHRTPQQPRYAG